MNPRGSDWDDQERRREDGSRKGTDRKEELRERELRDEGVDWCGARVTAEATE